MSGANVASRVDEVTSAAITQVAGGSLVVGPFAKDAIVQRFGAVIVAALDVGDVAVTTSPNVGSATLPNLTAANKVVVKDAVEDPAAVDGEAPEQFVLAAGDTLTVTAAAVGTATGDYHLFADVIKLPMTRGDADFVAG